MFKSKIITTVRVILVSFRVIILCRKRDYSAALTFHPDSKQLDISVLLSILYLLQPQHHQRLLSNRKQEQYQCEVHIREILIVLFLPGYGPSRRPLSKILMFNQNCPPENKIENSFFFFNVS